jgi:DNA sulfur modification protein DndC
MPLREENMTSETAVPGTVLFGGQGLKKAVKQLTEEIQELYLADQVPWVVGYSGGKDSTASLQLVWYAIAQLPPEQRLKPVHVISTDTLVENPVVAAWVKASLETMRQAAEQADMPIHPHRLTPEVQNTFWVNLIGRGYPAPRPRFRWCTERLKIAPSNDFIRKVVRESGEAILVLGTRKSESATRSAVMKRHAKHAVRDRLAPNSTLPNCLVYSPIEDWKNEEVWMFLLQLPNPWGYNNKELLSMYAGASQDNECPLVVDTGTPSCGDSRFGCWVCTLVSQDKSMQAMIQNDAEKEWMKPLSKLRNELDVEREKGRGLRDFRRMSGAVTLMGDQAVPGPYTQKAREEWLEKVLRAQQQVQNNPRTPAELRDSLELITLPELQEIRRIWVFEKHEVEDMVPAIYQEVVGEPFPGNNLDDSLVFGREEIRLLRELCGDDFLQFELIRELLHVEQGYQTMARRRGLFEAMEQAFQRSFYIDEEDATDRARRRRDALHQARDGHHRPQPQLPLIPDENDPSESAAVA